LKKFKSWPRYQIVYLIRPNLNVTYYSSIETDDLKYRVLRCPQGRKNPPQKGAVRVCFMRRKPCKVLFVKDVKKEIEVKYPSVEFLVQKGEAIECDSMRR
jgi:hypothetical protein